MGSTSGDFGGPNAPPQCTAMSKRSGERCKGVAVVGSPGQKCRMHGGSSHTIGTRDANFRHGRYSRYLPAKLDELHQEALANPELLEMGDHIALLEARIKEILGTMTGGEPVPKWVDLALQFGEIESAILSSDADRIQSGIERMHRLLANGEAWDSTWEQTLTYMEQLRKLTETEVKRKRELNQMVPVERVLILMTAVAHAVKRNVSDPAEVGKVLRELAQLQGGGRTAGGVERVGPEIVDVTPESRGVKGGGSSTAMALRRRQERAAEAEGIDA